MRTEQQRPVRVEAGGRLTDPVHMRRVTLTEDLNFGSLTRLGFLFMKSRLCAADPHEGRDGADRGQRGCARRCPLLFTPFPWPQHHTQAAQPIWQDLATGLELSSGA